MFTNYLGGGPRKLKRVSDVTAMGQPVPIPAPQPYIPNVPYGSDISYGAPGQDTSVNFAVAPQQAPQQAPQASVNYNYNPGVAPTPPAYDPYVSAPAASYPIQNQAPYNPNAKVPGHPDAGGQFAMFQQPIVQDMAMQYGQKLADQGKQLVESHFEKYVPVTRLKYYFAVDNQYVINKLRLIFFPFTHKVKSIFFSN